MPYVGAGNVINSGPAVAAPNTYHLVLFTGSGAANAVSTYFFTGTAAFASANSFTCSFLQLATAVNGDSTTPHFSVTFYSGTEIEVNQVTAIAWRGLCVGY
jgi:hypothetical protein